MDHCQLNGAATHYIQERKDYIPPQYMQSAAASVIHNDDNRNTDKESDDTESNVEQDDTSLYDDVVQNGDDMASIGGHFVNVEKSAPKAQAQTSNRLLPTVTEQQHDSQVQTDNMDLSKAVLVNIEISYYSFDCTRE